MVRQLNDRAMRPKTDKLFFIYHEDFRNFGILKGRATLFRRGKCIDSDSKGQALLEVAVTFPVFVLIILAIGAVIWTFWVQAASAIASQEAARAAAYRVGEDYDPAAGYGLFAETMVGITGSTSAGYIGNPQITVNPLTRSLQISLDRGVSFSSPAVSSDYAFRAGTFTRIMKFFGGPPDPWE